MHCTASVDGQPIKRGQTHREAEEAGIIARETEGLTEGFRLRGSNNDQRNYGEQRTREHSHCCGETMRGGIERETER